MRAFLDVNVLIALLDGGHLHHGLTTAWLARHIDEGWASSPITQNGCIRILSLRANGGGLFCVGPIREETTTLDRDREQALTRICL